MKTASIIVSAVVVGSAQAFTAGSLPGVRASQVVSYGYVPSGFTPEQYKKFKEAEAKKKTKQNLGGLGPRGFKSRSFQSFQEALERGEAEHLMPVFNAKEKVKRGELKVEDIPVRITRTFDVMSLDQLSQLKNDFLRGSWMALIFSTCNEEDPGITPM